MTLIDKLTRSPLSRGFILLLFYIAALGVFFRLDFLSHFATVINDRYDGIIEISLLEHWHNVLRGLEQWDTAIFFYPYTATLGYNDGYFLYGIIYSFFRTLGVDPFLAGDLVSMAVKSIGFFSCYYVTRHIVKIDFIFAAFAALIFTISNNSYFQEVHAQLFSVAFTPLMTILIYKAATAFNARSQKKLMIWGSLTGIFYAAWLLTSYYMAWFYAYFSLVFIIIYLSCLGPKLNVFIEGLRQNSRVLLVVGIVSCLALLPFLALYLPHRGLTANHGPDWTPALFDAFNIGYSNFLFGSLYEWLDHIVRIDNKDYSEYACGITPALFFVFLVSAYRNFNWQKMSFRKNLKNQNIFIVITLTIIISWLMTVHIMGWHHKGHQIHLTFWRELYYILPGGIGIRTICRYGILLAFPIIIIAIHGLSGLAHKSMLLALFLCCLITAEQVNSGHTGGMIRNSEIARIGMLTSPPQDCQVFYASVPREGTAVTNLEYSHNVDAMLSAELLHVPTINGFASYNPTDWNFKDTYAPDYHDRIMAYATAHHLQNLCALNLETLQWN